MKKLKYETRGVTAAVVISRIAPTGDPALDSFLKEAEDAFIARAEKYAEARRGEAEKMTPRERRRLAPVKIVLSLEKSGGPVALVTLTATLASDGRTTEKKTSFFWDGASSTVSKTPEKRKNGTSREKL